MLYVIKKKRKTVTFLGAVVFQAKKFKIYINLAHIFLTILSVKVINLNNIYIFLGILSVIKKMPSRRFFKLFLVFILKNWIDSFYKSKCLSFCPSVCPSVCLFTFEVLFKRLFAPMYQSGSEI